MHLEGPLKGSSNSQQKTATITDTPYNQRRRTWTLVTAVDHSGSIGCKVRAGGWQFGVGGGTDYRGEEFGEGGIKVECEGQR